jgi:hypothetical protein
MVTKLSSISSVADILDSISDDISLELFKIIAEGNEKMNKIGRIPIKTSSSSSSSSLCDVKNKITRKQYYSRMNRLMKCGLTKRSKRGYFLTSLGKVIYYNLRIVENACQIKWQLTAIDSLEASDIPAEATIKMFDSLVQDKTIREILHSSFPEAEKDKEHVKTQEQIPSSIFEYSSTKY